MKSYLRARLLLAFPAIGFSVADVCPSQPYLFQGTTINSVTKQSIENVHLYIVAGEEETFSGKDGVFKLNSWQSLPVTVVAEHSKFKTVKLVLKDATQKQVIVMEPK